MARKSIELRMVPKTIEFGLWFLVAMGIRPRVIAIHGAHFFGATVSILHHYNTSKPFPNEEIISSSYKCYSRSDPLQQTKMKLSEMCTAADGQILSK
jgi:hypothetical protein